MQLSYFEGASIGCDIHSVVRQRVLKQLLKIFQRSRTYFKPLLQAW